MSFDVYFSKVSDNMPSRTTKNSTKTTTPVDVQDELTNVIEANTIADPGTMDLVILKMTDNITKVINIKIGMVLEAIAGHSAKLQKVVKRPRASFFNDYSTAVVRRRKVFDEVKTRLKRIKMDYALLYSATLNIMVNGTPKKLYTPEEAAAFIDSLG
ncbi:unnamed protein product [Coregonus sp. 'balchen']|nr:unnamed protein product [Coregonus sp. 'balchen']